MSPLLKKGAASVKKAARSGEQEISSTELSRMHTENGIGGRK